jgi:hypothetical protein
MEADSKQFSSLTNPQIFSHCIAPCSGLAHSSVLLRERGLASEFLPESQYALADFHSFIKQIDLLVVINRQNKVTSSSR